MKTIEWIALDWIFFFILLHVIRRAKNLQYRFYTFNIFSYLCCHLHSIELMHHTLSHQTHSTLHTWCTVHINAALINDSSYNKSMVHGSLVRFFLFANHLIYSIATENPCVISSLDVAVAVAIAITPRAGFISDFGVFVAWAWFPQRWIYILVKFQLIGFLFRSKQTNKHTHTVSQSDNTEMVSILNWNRFA